MLFTIYIPATTSGKVSATKHARNRATMTLPNIIYLHSHDTGRYIQPYGHAIATPNLQRLAHEGILFRQAFSAAPTCSPSRAALLTGQSPHRSGMLGLAHRGFSLHDYTQHLLHTLRAAGYYSALAGMQHLAAEPGRLGFDAHLESASTHAKDVAGTAARFLQNAPSTPFFLDAGFFETHREFPAPEQEAAYTLPPAPLPDARETRADMAAYHASARLLDDGVGTILAALEASGHAENTLVIYTTDHGLAFPRMKCNLTDHGIGVSLIMRGPGPFAASQSCDAMISHIDLFPTLCDWLNIPAPAWLEGCSFLPVLRGEVAEINEEIFAEVTYHAAYEPQRAIRTPRYKYIRRFGERTTPVLPNCDDSPSKELLLRHSWREARVPQEALFDLIHDPNESNNLVAASEYAAMLQELRMRLNRWMFETEDPLLLGPVPAPSGAAVNDAGGLSPKEAVINVP
jgi:N-sulfoglucosamine sulfohydrolase